MQTNNMKGKYTWFGVWKYEKRTLDFELPIACWIKMHSIMIIFDYDKLESDDPPAHCRCRWEVGSQYLGLQGLQSWTSSSSKGIQDEFG